MAAGAISSGGAHRWSTYLGGTSNDAGRGIAVDTIGNVYATGNTYSSGWINGGWNTVYGGNSEGYIVKLDSSGMHLWSTYLGGSDNDCGYDIVVDGNGDVYAAGYTYSSGWINGGWNTVYGRDSDGYIVKLDSFGMHLWSTYLGGDNYDFVYGIAVDDVDNMYATGNTNSLGWVSGGWNTEANTGAYIVKMDASGTHLWSTYLDRKSNVTGRGIAVDSAGNIYVTGETRSYGWVSGGWDTTFGGNNNTDGYVIKLDSLGSPIWSTYLGGFDNDIGYGIAIDTSGNVYATGSTYSSNWPIGGEDVIYEDNGDVFVVKLDNEGAHLCSSYLGGSGSDIGYGIAVGTNGYAYVAGTTTSEGWVSDGWDISYNGSDDGFVDRVLDGGVRTGELRVTIDPPEAVAAGAQWRRRGTDIWFSSGETETLVPVCESWAIEFKQVLGWASSSNFVVAVSEGLLTEITEVYTISTTNLSWGAYFPGEERPSNRDTVASDMTCDEFGYVYVTGVTYDSDWVSGGWQTSLNGGADAYVVKLDPLGGHVWSTYMGGASTDEGYGIVVDDVGDIYITGSTGSEGWVSGGWQTSFNGNDDGFVVKLDTAGSHIWSTYLGGTERDRGCAITADADGNVCVIGETTSEDWISGGEDTTFAGDDCSSCEDGFVVKLSSSGTHLWSTYLGGNNDEYGFGIASDELGFVYATGYTESAGWLDRWWDTTADGLWIAYVVKLSPAGEIVWSVGIGDANNEQVGRSIDVDLYGNTYITGFEKYYYSGIDWVSGGWDTVHKGSDCGFVVKLDNAGEHLWSTFLGGAEDDYAYDIIVDGAGNAYVTGWTTNSLSWISGGIDVTWNGEEDGYVVKLSSSGEHLWSTYLGGMQQEYGYSIALDGERNVCAMGSTRSCNWLHGGWVLNHNEVGTYVVKIDQLTSFEPSNPSVMASDMNSITWSWQDNSDDETGFNMYADPGIEQPVTLQETTVQDITSWQYTGLSPNSSYAFCASTHNIYGDSGKTPVVNAYTGIEPVSDLIVSDVTVNSITIISANLPSHLEVGLSGLYLTNSSIGTNSGWRKDNTPWISDMLAPNTPYIFSGLTRNGEGVETIPVSVVRYTRAITPLAPLLNLPNIHGDAVHALDLFINTGDGNPASTRYAIQVAPPVSGDTWVQADGTVGPNPVFRMAAAWDARRVTGLAKATTYTFTATARNGEDIDTVPGPGMSLATADNLPAGAPTVSFPTVQSNIANLVCEIVIPSVDPDGDPVVYEYDWYVKHSGDSDFSLFSDGIPEASLLSQIDNMNTTPGDIWYCMVTPHDMDMAGTPVTTPECTIVLGGVTPSFMSFGVSPLEVTLGQSLTVLGQIFPTPSGSGTVTFESTSPSGVVSNTFPEGTVFSSGVYMKSFYPTEATEARPAWSVTASWPGDLTYQAATSSPVTFTVLRAQPDLQLSLSHTSALLNLSGAETFTVTADLSVAGFPSELLPLLAGCTIRLSVQTPDGQTPWAPLEALTDANGMAHFDKTVFDGAGIVFDQSGVWRFRSQFDGDVNLRSASTADFATTAARLTIKEGAGYAIIVLGRLDAAAEGHGEHAQTSDYIYSVLKGRGFADEDIYYLREHLAGEEDRGHPVSGAATAANLQYAIETWAQNKMLASPAPLYLILVDHGNPGIFYLDVGATGPVEFVTAGNIGGWLDVLQSALGVVKESAAEQPITIVYGACYSGSFIPALSGTNRIIIASSSGNEIAYRGVKNTETLLRDGDFFLTEFFRNAGEGRTVKDAFELACHKSYEYTASRTGSGANIPQHPRLDDNSDGSGTTGLLSSVAGLDGALVAGMDLGLGSNAGNSVGWFTAIPPVFLSPGEPLAEDIWAEATGRELIPTDESWIEVKTPVYDDGAVATAGYETFQRVASMAGPIVSGTAPESLGDGRTRHRWSYADLTGHPDLAGGFTTPGTYKVYYFLRDGITGQVGAYLVTNIYVSQTGNLPPAAVTQLYPADDGIVNVSLFLAWTESVDPDGDPVTYRVEVSEDPAFPVATTLVKDGLTDTVLTLDVGDGIENDHDYYWRVIPTDPYGASPSPNDVRRFLVRGSPGVPGAITGSVTDMDSGVGINGCTLTLSPTALEGASMASGGYFLGSVSQGVYNLTLSAPGYSDLQVNGVIVTSGRYTVLNLQLEPDGNRPPTLTLIGNKQVTHGHTLSFQVTATDPDAAQTLTYGEAGLPLGASFDTVTGQCIWQPTQSAVAGSPYTVTFSVTDNGDPILSDEETIQIIVNLGAYISGLSLVTVGEWVELEFHGEDIPDAWETHWRHEGHDIIGEMDALLILGEATLDHTGLYEATQVFSKDDPITATFYLTVSEGVPLHKSALLLLITLLVSLALVYAGKKWKQEGMDN